MLWPYGLTLCKPLKAPLRSQGREQPIPTSGYGNFIVSLAFRAKRDYIFVIVDVLQAFYG